MLEPKTPKAASELDKTERSVLLYLESCAVDRGGLVEEQRMNGDDMDAIMPWMLSGFIVFKGLQEDIRTSTHYVELSEDAWRIAAEARKMRSVNNKYPEVSDEG